MQGSGSQASASVLVCRVGSRPSGAPEPGSKAAVSSENLGAVMPAGGGAVSLPASA